MEDFLHSQKPIIIDDDEMSQFLKDRKPIIIHEENLDDNVEQFSEDVIIPPLNTDIRFSKFLPLHIPTQDEAEGHSQSHPFFEASETNEIIIPPLNTDIRFSKELPLHYPSGPMSGYTPKEHVHPGQSHPKKLHIHDLTNENFSWAISTQNDSALDLVKKSLIHKVSTQHACGSCWAVAFADTMSDCFVVSGAVGWSPNISATYIMSCVPSGRLHNMCFGGNPAAVAPYLEREGVADTSCVDYSWCSGDEMCKSLSSARHFDAKTLSSKLNKNIPKPCGCYSKDVKKYLFKLDPGSDVFYINNSAPIKTFRNSVRSHILDFGPVIGGYVVLKNFFKGNFTNPNLNGGIYFDRADYNNLNGNKIRFTDSITKEAAGLHAVSIVGWGIGKNIQYDNDKIGDVPYWHCRNSWGESWGQEGGYFKIAMYPFNKIAQFDKQVMTEIGGPVGSMILIRATERPRMVDLSQISENYLKNIKRQESNAYYMADPVKVREMNRRHILDIDVVDPGNPVVVESPIAYPTKIKILSIVFLAVMILLILRLK
jgi:hypothetical protein